MNYTSQYGQDKWVVEYFKSKQNGYFIDLAAGDGIFLSNTYVLEKELGWTGICIEANDDNYAKLILNRTLCDNNCILDDGTKVNFKNITNATGWENLLSCIETLAPWKHATDSITEKITISLNTLLNNHNAPDVIDYISLDIEFSELPVLIEFFKTNKRKVLLWTIEHSNEPEVISLMKSNGYKHITKIKADNVFELI